VRRRFRLGARGLSIRWWRVAAAAAIRSMVAVTRRTAFRRGPRRPKMMKPMWAWRR